MIYFLCVLIPFLLGYGVVKVLYGKKGTADFGWADSILTGGMVVIGLAEAAHVGVVVLGQSFSDCEKLFFIGIGVLLLVAVLLFAWEPLQKKKKRKQGLQKQQNSFWQIPIFIFMIIGFLQVLSVATEQKIYLTGDMTVETVNSILTTDAVYQVNPLTGQPYTLGMPMRLKILCLPTLYAILCDVFKMSAIQVVWVVVPVCVVLGSYLAFYTVAKALFEEEAKKRGFFMLLVALLLWVGNYMYGMDGFGLQHAGYRGVTIRMAILLPYTVGLMLRKKWKLVVLCILAEACIVWTLYGMGVCLLVAVGMGLIEGLKNKNILMKKRCSKEEGR